MESAPTILFSNYFIILNNNFIIFIHFYTFYDILYEYNFKIEVLYLWIDIQILKKLEF